jgi:hypothetical protein
VTSQAWPGLKHVELVAEQVALFFHLDVEDGWLPPQHEQLANAVSGRDRAVAVRAGGASQGRSGSRGARGRGRAVGASWREGSLEAAQRLRATAERSEALEAVLADGRHHFGCGGRVE